MGCPRPREAGHSPHSFFPGEGALSRWEVLSSTLSSAGMEDGLIQAK